MEKHENFIVTYENQKYDIKSFLKTHPGGYDILEEHKGKDITTAFDEINHSQEAKQLMKKYILDESNKKAAVPFTPENKPIKKDAFTINWKLVKDKLFTKEDNMFIHKFFGFLCLASFIYRYMYFVKFGTLGFENNSWFDFATLAVHFLLSFSSLIFHVLEKRLASNPLIIYEEYRLHAIIFTGKKKKISSTFYKLFYLIFFFLTLKVELLLFHYLECPLMYKVYLTQ